MACSISFFIICHFSLFLLFKRFYSIKIFFIKFKKSLIYGYAGIFCSRVCVYICFQSKIKTTFHSVYFRWFLNTAILIIVQTLLLKIQILFYMLLGIFHQHKHRVFLFFLLLTIHQIVVCPLEPCTTLKTKTII